MAYVRSGVWEELARVTAEIQNGTRKSWWRPQFRDEREEWEFQIEMKFLDMRATMWKMTEQLKIMKKYGDRHTPSGSSAERPTDR